MKKENPILKGVIKSAMLKEAKASIELDKGETQTFTEEPYKFNIKNIKFINSNSIKINGDEFVKRKSFVTELEALVNHTRVSIHKSHIIILGNMCFNCGKIFKSKKEMESLTKHHSIQACFRPKYNVFIPVCRKCQDKIHNLEKKR